MKSLVVLQRLAVCCLILFASGVAAPAATTRLTPHVGDKKQEAAQSAAKDGDRKEPGEAPNPDLREIPAKEYWDGPPTNPPGWLESQLRPEYIPTSLPQEVEPNGTTATATPLVGTQARVRGNIVPNGDVDIYSFSAGAGDRVYAAVMTSFSAADLNSTLALIASDGTTVLETDLDDGSFGATSSTIAGRTVPTAGTYYLRVTQSAGTLQIRPYDLYLRVQTGAPTPEVETNDTTATANPLPATGWVSGSLSAVTDVDFYALNLNVGDTIYMGLDLDPERDTVEGNGILGLGIFGTAPVILQVNDLGTATPDSEAFFFTVKTAGTYFVQVAAATTFGTYHLSVAVFPRPGGVGACTTYTSTNVPVAIGNAGPNIVTSTLTVPGNPIIYKMRVNITLNHTFINDLDVQLTSPNGATIGLFSDIGAATVGGAQTGMDIALDDDAAIPSSYAVTQTFVITPELAYRLSWLNGTKAGGDWILTIRDDATGDGGSLTAWSLDICENPLPLCGGPAPVPIFSTDFESGAAGFTHSGTADEWQLGLPSFAPITTANSGVNCWKTDLDNTYDMNSSQDLFSPNIVLPATGPLRLTWAQKYQMENENFDHMFVEVREVPAGGMVRRVFEWLDATMQDNVGNPNVTIQEASGWSLCERDISDFAGKTIQVVWHVDSDPTVQLAGLAVDDVRVDGCALADVGITSFTDSPDPRSVGGLLTYAINVVNNGPQVANATVSLPLPAGTTFASATQPAGWTPSTPAVGGTGTVTFNNPTFANAGTASFTVVVTPACTVANSTMLTATASIGSTLADPVSINNSAMTTTTVTNAAPTVTCPANITKSNDANQCGSVTTYTTPTAVDDSGCSASVVCSPASGSFFPVGTTTVTCTATDAAAQTGSCTFTVTVNDTQAPAITCPANQSTMESPPGSGSATVTYAAPTVTDNCPSVGAPVCTPASGSAFPVGTTTVNCSVTDAHANTSSCSFTVTVTAVCSITCPANITVGNQANQCGAVVTYPAPSTTGSGCGAVACSPASGSFFPKGTTTVTCNATGASCSFTVTVNDTQAPTITCPPNIVTGNAPGLCSQVVSYVTTASDNCPGVTVACSPASGSSFPLGTTTVACTATDATGNTATCSFTVKVNDTQAPAITCPANISTPANTLMGLTPGAVVSYATPAASDNCPGLVTVMCAPASGSFFPAGVTTVTCSATDAAGNTGSCSFTVTVTVPFTSCFIDDGTGDTLSIITDPANPLYGFWRLRIAATGATLVGNAEYVQNVPGRSLIAYDHDAPSVRMDVNVNYASRTATATVKNLTTGVTYVIRDRNIANNPPCT